MDDKNAEPSVLMLAEGLLRAEFQRQAMADPQQALETVNRLVLGMHSVAASTLDTALKAGVSWHEVGRAHAALEGSGILLRQAAALLLGLPAADRAAEQEMLAQALGEEAQETDDAAPGLDLPHGQHPDEDAWSAAVQRFQQHTKPRARPMEAR